MALLCVPGIAKSECNKKKFDKNWMTSKLKNFFEFILYSKQTNLLIFLVTN